jgi:predicted transcriptional regulator of viral defense system
LVSALYHHNLATQIPHQIHIALPRDVKTPKIEYPPIRVFHLSEKPYLAGIEEKIMDGVNIKIYNLEKTITDCFKFREKIGTNIAIEALKDYLIQSDTNVPLLMKYARVNRMEKVMSPYLEALL